MIGAEKVSKDGIRNKACRVWAKAERKHTFAQAQTGALHFGLENYTRAMHVGCTHYAVRVVQTQICLAV